MVLLFGFVAAGTVTNFFPTVVATLKYGNVESLLLTAPPYVRPAPSIHNRLANLSPFHQLAAIVNHHLSQ